MKKTLIDIYKEKIFLENGEDALHLAGVIRRYGKDGWTKNKISEALGMIDPKFRSGANDISERRNEIMAMLMDPKNHLPMDEITIKLAEIEGISTKDYATFMAGWKKFLKENSAYFDDFLDLYLVFAMKKNQSSDNGIIDDLIKMTQNVDFLSLDLATFNTFEEIYNSLLPSDKKFVADSIKDPYVRGALTRNAKALLIVDGSNIAMVGSLYPDLNNIFLSFRLIGKMHEIPWPFKIIFDENFEYNLKGTQRRIFEERFQKHPDVKFHSPADELIIEIAKSTNSWILSNDRYHDYPRFNATFLRFDGKRVWKD
ncbi:hypothetical protein [Athalassotoga saccharophila]|uniref:hypothetical protein n=1 Tax=Athalassotoga saccharophila TaxID=1441386 RepID=UPI00137B8B4A|nr:hypothetical protein [Athalassotoga saccharophila]BBJ28498.1 hypothetical protein ATHSA_1412 [Athalassotoga saccharophila]